MTKFKKGQSGNPGGKKPGTLNKRTMLATLLEPYAEGLVNKTVELAMDGDVNALRLCIERLIPKAIGQQIQIDLQGLDIERSKTLPIIGKKIIDATAKGDLSVQDGNQFMHLINTQREFLAQEELAKRLDEIESHQKTGCLFDELE